MYPAGVSGVEVRYVTVGDGVRLRVAESGPADGPPVVLLHGWAASLWSWRHLLRDLPQAGFHAVAFDFRGHGLSDKPLRPGDHTRERFVADVVEVMDAMDIATAAVIGHSMGGGVALRLAIDHADRVGALVLLNPVGLAAITLIGATAKLSPGFLDVLAPLLVPRWVVNVILHWASGDTAHIDDRTIDEYWAPSRDPNYVRAVRALLRDFDWSPATPDELRRVHAPSLVILGGADRVIRRAGPAASVLPHGRVLPLPGLGHMAHEESPREVDAAIVAFLGAEARIE